VRKESDVGFLFIGRPKWKHADPEVRLRDVVNVTPRVGYAFHQQRQLAREILHPCVVDGPAVAGAVNVSVAVASLSIAQLTIAPPEHEIELAVVIVCVVDWVIGGQDGVGVGEGV
jgi:hypothetical protein